MGKYRTNAKSKVLTNESPHRDKSNFTSNGQVSGSESNADVGSDHYYSSKPVFLGNQKIRTKRHIILTLYGLALFATTYFSAQAAPPDSNYNTKSNSINIQDNILPVFPVVKSVESSTGYSFIVSSSDSGSSTNGYLAKEEEAGKGSGTLKALQNCSRPSSDDFPGDLFTKDERRGGAVVIHFVVSIYLFYALLLVCDEFFVPAVESICRDLKIPSDVAGATFMAVSTSAPELFTNIIGTFVTKGDIGVGTIVGSAVFNILAVGAMCGIGAGYTVKKMANGEDKIGVRLEWYPLTRDSIFYLLSVAALIAVLNNRKVYWTEALFLIVIYCFYVLVLCFNTKLKTWSEEMVNEVNYFFSIKSDNYPRRISVVVGKVMNNNERTPLLLKVTEKGEICSPEIDGESKSRKTSDLDHFISKEYDIPAESLDEVLIFNALTRSNSFCQQEAEDCSALCNPPKEADWKLYAEWIISWPIRFALTMTIPDCRLYQFRKWYWVTLAMCIVWIASLSYFISWMVTIIGDTLSIPDSVTGLTFLAAGTSIPEVMSSVIVSKQGLGSMAFSNTIGSNTFDVLVCLGLPWLIQTAIMSTQEINYIEIQSGGLEYSAILLVSALLLVYFFIAFNGFILDKKIGLACILMYIVFITFACMLEMNVFFPVNLPPC